MDFLDDPDAEDAQEDLLLIQHVAARVASVRLARAAIIATLPLVVLAIAFVAGLGMVTFSAITGR